MIEYKYVCPKCGAGLVIVESFETIRKKSINKIHGKPVGDWNSDIINTHTVIMCSEWGCSGADEFVYDYPHLKK